MFNRRYIFKWLVFYCNSFVFAGVICCRFFWINYLQAIQAIFQLYLWGVTKRRSLEGMTRRLSRYFFPLYLQKRFHFPQQARDTPGFFLYRGGKTTTKMVHQTVGDSSSFKPLVLVMTGEGWKGTNVQQGKVISSSRFTLATKKWGFVAIDRWVFF